MYGEYQSTCYDTVKLRLKIFMKWRGNVGPVDLTIAGFYYTNLEDIHSVQ